MATGRSRSRSWGSNDPGFYHVKFGSSTFGPYYGSLGVSHQDYCDDYTEAPPYNDHALNLTHRYVDTTGRVNGSIKSGSFTYVYSGWVPASRCNYQYTPTPDPVSWTYWRTKALANVSPSRAKYNVPLFVYELRELPGMIRDLGRVLQGRARPSDVPGGYLSYQFGWAPLISDVRSFFDFAKSWEDRKEYLRRTEEGTRVRRRLHTQTLVESGSYSPVAGLTCGTELTKEMRVWYSCTIKRRSPIPASKLPPELDLLGNVLGFHSTPKLLWDAIPWTWLIDYFANVGDFLEASNGLLRYDVRDMNVMVFQKLVDRVTSSHSSGGTLFFDGGDLVTISKQRSATPLPLPGLALRPLLTNKQKSILGALGTAKALRAFGK